MSRSPHSRRRKVARSTLDPLRHDDLPLTKQPPSLRSLLSFLPALCLMCASCILTVVDVSANGRSDSTRLCPLIRPLCVSRSQGAGGGRGGGGLGFGGADREMAEVSGIVRHENGAARVLRLKELLDVSFLPGSGGHLSALL